MGGGCNLVSLNVLFILRLDVRREQTCNGEVLLEKYSLMVFK